MLETSCEQGSRACNCTGSSEGGAEQVIIAIYVVLMVFEGGIEDVTVGGGFWLTTSVVERWW